MRLHGLLWHGLAVGLGLIPALGAARAQQPVSFGTPATGEIAVAAERDEWTITAQPGDVLLVRAARASGNLWPRVRIDGSIGNAIADFEGIVLAENLVTVPAGGGGTLAVRISDGFDETHTGLYSLYIERLTQPGNATALSIGSTHAGEIQHPGEMHARTFTGQPGDVLVARMANRESSGNTIWPLIRLYGPAGNLVKEEHRPVSADFTATLSAAGPYTLLVGDGFDGTFTGRYGLFVQRVNRPEGVVPLDFAHATAEAIESPGVMRTYSVSLPEGYDSPLAVRMRQTSGKLWPLLRLYAPDGAMLLEESSFKDTLLSATVAGGRTYLLIAGDGFNGAFTGSYTIGWSYALSDVARALRLMAGTADDTAAARERLNADIDGESAHRVDISDAVWIARSAAGLQARP